MKYSAKWLQKASGHVLYELWMLNEAGSRIATGNNDQVAHNAYLESMLTHARSLVDFFYRPAKKKNRRNDDDIKVEHFFTRKKDWLQIRPLKPFVLRRDQLWRPVGKYVAHLTYRRLKKRSWWPNIQIVLEINKVAKIFLGVVPQKYLSSEFISFEKGYQGWSWKLK